MLGMQSRKRIADRRLQINRGHMSTLKTVLATAAVLLLGSVLSVGGYIVYQQQQDIDALTSQVIVLMNKSVDMQKQTSAIDKRLNATIKTSNHNFKELEQDDDTLTDALKMIIRVLGSGSESSPSSYTQSRNGL